MYVCFGVWNSFALFMQVTEVADLHIFAVAVSVVTWYDEIETVAPAKGSNFVIDNLASLLQLQTLHQTEQRQKF